MALQLEQTLYNADVVRYHRVGSLDVNGATVTATLDSFRNFDHRAMPVAPVISRKFPFSYSGEPGGAIAAAYVAIKQLPEWQAATDV
jgi:hypothetical protein